MWPGDSFRFTVGPPNSALIREGQEARFEYGRAAYNGRITSAVGRNTEAGFVVDAVMSIDPPAGWHRRKYPCGCTVTTDGSLSMLMSVCPLCLGKEK